MKLYVLAILSSLVFISAGYAQTADVAAVSETDVVSQDSTEEKILSKEIWSDEVFGLLEA